MRAIEAATTLPCCPGAEMLERLVADEPVDDELRRHVVACAACRAVMESIRLDNALIEEWRLAAGATGTAGDPAAGPAGQACAATPLVQGYEIRGEIRRGGQGVVFDAVQLSTRRRVALKLLLNGRFSTARQRRRFEREIEAVSALRDPGIVTLFESGTTDAGDLYFAMEHVDGLPLDEAWAQRRAGGGGGGNEALRLLAGVARAVKHAHQRGVIHRDLKPSNILVDADGEPRLLDFGIARLSGGVGAATTADDFAGTFAYAAPEQFGPTPEGSDVRVDVYALGVILHELLTGDSPYGRCGSAAELLRRKLAPSGEPLSEAAAPRLDRDTWTIVRKAMAADPARRYQSAAELLDDLERRLDGRPIAARQDSVLYVLGKAAQRHRRVVAAATAAVLLLVALTALLAATLVRHEQERTRAIDTLRTLREALATVDPLGGGRIEATLAAFVAEVGGHVERNLNDSPAAAAAIHGTLGQIALSGAEYDVAAEHLARALDLSRRAEDPALEAEMVHHLGRVEFFQGRYPAAVELYLDALARRRILLGEGHPDVATTLSHLGSSLRRLGRVEEAETHLRQALAIRAAAGAPLELAAAWNNLGSLHLESGRLDEATSMFERAVDLLSAAATSDDWRLAHVLRNQGACLIELGRHAEAWKALAGSERLWRATVDEDHPALAAVLHQQARAALGLGKIDEAVARAAQALEVRRSRLGADHPEVAESLRVLGTAHGAAERNAEAHAAFAEALRIRRAALPPDHPLLAESTGDLGAALLRLGDVAAARPLLAESRLLWSRHAAQSPHRATAAQRLHEEHRDRAHPLDLPPILEP